VRVGDAQPRLSSSITTRILLQDGNIYFGSLPPAPVRTSNDPLHDGGSFGVVWVNNIGHESMTAAKPEKFPVGSVIVREKFTHQEDTKPELLAVMVKRGNGFNRKGGDWEYLIVEGGLTKIRQRQTKGNCSSCHAQQKDRDFVFPLPQTKETADSALRIVPVSP
jgi:hypothetical protein